MPQRGGRPPKYPWDTWMSQLKAEGRILLQPIQDFPLGTSPSAVRSGVLTQARKRGILVRTQLYGTGLGVYYLGAAVGEEELDWSALFDGEAHRLQQGKDFSRSPADMVEYILRVAYDRGYTLRARAEVGTVTFRAILDTPTERVSS